MHLDCESRWYLRNLGLFGLVLGCMWATVCAYALHAALPFNPVKLPFERWVQVRLWMPEGWAFFTRDPREERMLLFKRDSGGRWVSASIGPNSKLSNDLGLNRASRAQSMEAALLLSDFPTSMFQDCRDSPVDCLQHIRVSGSFKNISPDPTLCGELGIAMQPPIPWAWMASGHPVIMPSRVLRMDVTCG
jgi:antimicrobial peptide system SdpA family protein